MKDQTIEGEKKPIKAPTHFEYSHLAKYDKILSRDINSRQLSKICFSCKKGFCKRKGRAKYAPVYNEEGRYICQICAEKLMRGEAIDGMEIIDI